MKREAEDRIITTPNILSTIRLIIVPIIYVAFRREKYLLAMFLVILSGLTDLLDGIIARKSGQITKIGKILDPVADKLTQFCLLICIMKQYPFVLVTAIIFALKETSMGLYNLYFMLKGNEYKGAIIYGKISTFVFYICTILLFIAPNLNYKFAYILIAFTTITLMYSWIGHMIAYYKQYKAYFKK